MQMTKFKYQNEIDALVAFGCQLPELYAPNGIPAYRFAFSNSGRQNHVPQYVASPKRMLLDIGKNKASTSLLALSCFDTAVHAESFYQNLKKAFRNISSAIGDSLSEGPLTDADGKKTATSANGHFDFYEYEGCDLNKTFLITKILSNKDEGDKRI